MHRAPRTQLFFRARLENAGTTIADATALFIAVDTSHFHQGGQQLPPEWADWSPANLPDSRQITAPPDQLPTPKN